MKIAEPANDLAMVMAIASAATGQPLKRGVAAIGEVGLTGEVRMVTHWSGGRQSVQKWALPRFWCQKKP